MLSLSRACLFVLGFVLPLAAQDWPNWREGNEFKATRDADLRR